MSENFSPFREPVTDVEIRRSIENDVLVNKLLTIISASDDLREMGFTPKSTTQTLREIYCISTEDSPDYDENNEQAKRLVREYLDPIVRQGGSYPRLAATIPEIEIDVTEKLFDCADLLLTWDDLFTDMATAASENNGIIIRRLSIHKRTGENPYQIPRFPNSLEIGNPGVWTYEVVVAVENMRTAKSQYGIALGIDIEQASQLGGTPVELENSILKRPTLPSLFQPEKFSLGDGETEVSGSNHRLLRVQYNEEPPFTVIIGKFTGARIIYIPPSVYDMGRSGDSTQYLGDYYVPSLEPLNPSYYNNSIMEATIDADGLPKGRIRISKASLISENCKALADYWTETAKVAEEDEKVRIAIKAANIEQKQKTRQEVIDRIYYLTDRFQKTKSPESEKILSSLNLRYIDSNNISELNLTLQQMESAWASLQPEQPVVSDETPDEALTRLRSLCYSNNLPEFQGMPWTGYKETDAVLPSLDGIPGVPQDWKAQFMAGVRQFNSHVLLPSGPGVVDPPEVLGKIFLNYGPSSGLWYALLRDGDINDYLESNNIDPRQIQLTWEVVSN